MGDQAVVGIFRKDEQELLDAAEEVKATRGNKAKHDAAIAKAGKIAQRNKDAAIAERQRVQRAKHVERGRVARRKDG